MLDETMERLKHFNNSEHGNGEEISQRIEGVPNYDILMNPEYSMAF